MRFFFVNAGTSGSYWVAQDKDGTLYYFGGTAEGTDPDALGSIGVKLLTEMKRRHFEGLPRGGTSSKHVELAETRHGIGVADLEKIELIKVGATEDSLI